jgi:hypothetical protein
MSELCPRITHGAGETAATICRKRWDDALVSSEVESLCYKCGMGRLMACWLTGMIVALLVACSSEKGRPECIDLPATCNPLYLLDGGFQTLFDKTLQPKCGEDSACHSAEGRRGGLVFANVDEAYAMLLGQNGGKMRAKPGDPSCSEVVVRTHSVGEAWQMPPGNPLNAEERCVIRLWVEQGAER